MVHTIRPPCLFNALGANRRISASTGSLVNAAVGAASGPTGVDAVSADLISGSAEKDSGYVDGTRGMKALDFGRLPPVLAWQALSAGEADDGSSVSSRANSRPGSRGSRPGSRGGTRKQQSLGSVGEEFFRAEPLWGQEQFRDCDREASNFLLQHGRTKYIDVGDLIVDGGRGDTDVYILQKGSADVEVGGATVLQIGGGAIFGEMKLLSSAGPQKAVAVRARTLCECRVLSQAALLHARRSPPSDKRFLVQLEHSQRQFELRIERAVRAETPASNASSGRNAVGKQSSNGSRSTAATSTAGDSFQSENSPTSEASGAASFNDALHLFSRAPSHGRSPSRSPSPVPTPLLEELRQRRLVVLRDSAAVLADKTCYVPGGSEATSVSGASQKSSPHLASEGPVPPLVENQLATKAATQRVMASASPLGVNLHHLVMPQQAGVALPSGIAPVVQNGSALPLSRPVTPPDGIVTPPARPTHNAALPPADGLPGTRPDGDDTLPLYIDAADDDELPRLVRQASRAGSRCSTPAGAAAGAGRRLSRSDSSPSEIKRADNLLRSGLSPNQNQVSLSQSLAMGVTNDFVASSRSHLLEAREQLLTRRCAREQQARPQRARLAECGRNLVGR